MEFQKISVTSTPPNTRRATKILREGGGGVQKETIFQGLEVGWPLESFFLGGEGGPSKIDEQTNSYFAVGGRLSAFFTACTIVYVTQLLSAYD